MLQWSNKSSRNVVLAVEPGIDEVILKNLCSVAPFNDDDKWSFNAINHSDLFKTIANPDVLLISRFLPGEKPHEVLQYVCKNYSMTHVVLLVGQKNDQCRHYVRLAREMGFENIITGDLPGDLPYTIDLAIQYTYHQVLLGKTGKASLLSKEAKRGMVIASAGAKGGVGKTSVTAGIAQALASRGIKSTVCDTDFSRQDLTAFFKVSDYRGFMKSANEVTDIKRAVVPIDKNIYILPGPGPKTHTSWPESEQIKTILSELRDTAPFVIVDTPSDLNCSHTPVILQEADVVFVNIDQSLFTDQDIYDYGAFLLEHGITSDKVNLIVNRYSRKLMPVREIARAFNQGIRGDVKVVAMIPEQWERYALASHKGHIPGTNKRKGPWQAIVTELVGDTDAHSLPYYRAWFRKEA